MEMEMAGEHVSDITRMDLMLLLRKDECPITVILPPIIDNRPWRMADGGWRRLGNLGCGCAANAEGLAC